MPENSDQKYLPVTNVIFDLDGLLIDSEVRFANAISILLKRFG
jgi:beta-phosphoglucomutase-like phosphatase (HAD superfamily)